MFKWSFVVYGSFVVNGSSVVNLSFCDQLIICDQQNIFVVNLQSCQLTICGQLFVGNWTFCGQPTTWSTDHLWSSDQWSPMVKETKTDFKTLKRRENNRKISPGKHHFYWHNLTVNIAWFIIIIQTWSL